MAFCSKCGQELRDGAKYCDSCGAPTDRKPANSERRTAYEGVIHKCPNCGEVLNSFISSCPSCGYELRDSSSSMAMRTFFDRLDKATSPQEEARIINAFPIPNTREDILEFFILSSSAVAGEIDTIIADAWRSKIDQAYKKAKIVIPTKDDFMVIKEEYDRAVLELNKKRRTKHVGGLLADLAPVLPHVIVVFAWLVSLFVIIPICRTNIDNHHGVGYQLLFIIVLILGAAIIPKLLKTESVLPRVITVLGLLLSIVVLISLRSGNVGIGLMLIVDIICSIVVFVRIGKNTSRATKDRFFNSASLIVGLLSVVLLMGTYGIATLSVSKSIDDNSFKWLETGLSTMIPHIDAKDGEITENSETDLEIQLTDISYSEFDEYISSCQEMGYTVDSKKDTDEYIAYNGDGYYLEVEYRSYRKTLEITLKAPLHGDPDFTWPDSKLSSMIPQMDEKLGKVVENGDDSLKIMLYDVTGSEFKAYVSSIVDYGFNIDSKTESNSFEAYNQDGYNVLVLYKDMKAMEIAVESPMQFTKTKWPSSGPATMLPQPPSDMMNIVIDFDDSFSVYVSGMSLDDFNDYVEKCIKNGFEKDYRHDTHFSGYKTDNEDIDLTVEYVGYNIVYIRISDFGE